MLCNEGVRCMYICGIDGIVCVENVVLMLWRYIEVTVANPVVGPEVIVKARE